MKLRIALNEVTDIDYFTYPQKYLIEAEDDLTEEMVIKDQRKYRDSKLRMCAMVKELVEGIKQGHVNLPESIYVLSNIRKFRCKTARQLEAAEHALTLKLNQSFDVVGIMRKMQTSKFKSEIQRIKNNYECAHDALSVTTLRSSFQSNQLSEVHIPLF